MFIAAYFLLPETAEERTFDGQYIIAILGFLTAFLVYFGYRLFSKKKTAASVVLICLITLVFVLAAQVCASMIDFYRTSGRDLFSSFGIVFPMHFAVEDYFKPMIPLRRHRHNVCGGMPDHFPFRRFHAEKGEPAEELHGFAIHQIRRKQKRKRQVSFFESLSLFSD